MKRFYIGIGCLAVAMLFSVAMLSPVVSQGSGISACLYDATPDTYTDGQFVPCHVNSTGALTTTSTMAAGATTIAKAEDGAAASGEVGVPALAKQKAAPADEATDLDYAFLQMDDGALWTRTLSEQGFVITSTITRIADHTAYTAADAISDSTTTPTVGGFTFTGACRVSGGTGVITDIIITDSDDSTTDLQPSLFIYNTAVTAINDNAAFAVTDAEARTLVAKIVGTILLDDGAQNTLAITGLNINYNCSGSANLRWLLRADNAYDPAANDGVIQVMIKGRWTS